VLTLVEKKLLPSPIVKFGFAGRDRSSFTRLQEENRRGHGIHKNCCISPRLTKSKPKETAAGLCATQHRWNCVEKAFVCRSPPSSTSRFHDCQLFRGRKKHQSIRLKKGFRCTRHSPKSEERGKKCSESRKRQSSIPRHVCTEKLNDGCTYAKLQPI